MNCKTYPRSNQIINKRNDYYQSNRHNKFTNSRRNNPRDRNFFSPLYDFIEYFNYHKFGHKATECRLRNFIPTSWDNKIQEEPKFWKNIKDEKKGKCGLVLYAQNKNSYWYVDSGCWRPITGDKIKFFSFNKNKSRNIILNNDVLGKINGKKAL